MLVDFKSDLSIKNSVLNSVCVVCVVCVLCVCCVCMCVCVCVCVCVSCFDLFYLGATKIP